MKGANVVNFLATRQWCMETYGTKCHKCVIRTTEIIKQFQLPRTDCPNSIPAETFHKRLPKISISFNSKLACKCSCDLLKTWTFQSVPCFCSSSQLPMKSYEPKGFSLACQPTKQPQPTPTNQPTSCSYPLLATNPPRLLDTHPRWHGPPTNPPSREPAAPRRYNARGAAGWPRQGSA